MSNTPDSSPEQKAADHMVDALNRAALARKAHRYGEALIWVNTAGCLDSADDRADPASPVNLALFQLVFDVAKDCENLVLKCGNVTTTHGDWLIYGNEALSSLQGRFTDATPDVARSAVTVMSGHFDALFERLARHLNRGRYTHTTAQEARLLLDSVSTASALVLGLAERNPDFKIEQSVVFGERAALLYTCASSPDYEVHGFPFQFLNDWDKALFFLEGAQAVLAEMQARPSFVPADKSAAVARLSDLLEQAVKFTRLKDKRAKSLFPILGEVAEGIHVRN